MGVPSCLFFWMNQFWLLIWRDGILRAWNDSSDPKITLMTRFSGFHDVVLIAAVDFIAMTRSLSSKLFSQMFRIDRSMVLIWLIIPQRVIWFFCHIIHLLRLWGIDTWAFVWETLIIKKRWFYFLKTLFAFKGVFAVIRNNAQGARVSAWPGGLMWSHTGF